MQPRLEAVLANFTYSQYCMVSFIDCLKRTAPGLKIQAFNHDSLDTLRKHDSSLKVLVQYDEARKNTWGGSRLYLGKNEVSALQYIYT